jgi:hypothetical protein
MIKIVRRDLDRSGPVFPSKVINKCDAIIFTANRTAQVPGPIMFMIASIYTTNCIKIGGVP